MFCDILNEIPAESIIISGILYVEIPAPTKYLVLFKSDLFSMVLSGCNVSAGTEEMFCEYVVLKKKTK